MKDLFGASARFRLEFDDGDEVRPDHDTDVCSCCGEEKTAIVSVPFEFFATKDGDLTLEPDTIEQEPIRLGDGLVRQDSFVANIPHLSFSTLEDSFLEENVDNLIGQGLTLADNVLHQVDAMGDFEADIAGLEDGSIDYEFADAESDGIGLELVGITHPVLPTHARVCPEHGVTFANGEIARCCDDATITYEIDPDTQEQSLSEIGTHINTRIKQELREATSEQRNRLQNPYEKSGIIPTDALVPFLYKHGDDGVVVWDILQPKLFAEGNETVDHPTLGMPDDTVKELEHADISKAEYVEMAHDLFETLRVARPPAETTRQIQMMKEQFPQLHQATVGNQSVMETMTPVWKDVLTQDELSDLADTGTMYSTYRDAYRNGATYEYDEETLADRLDGNHVMIPADVFEDVYGRYSNMEAVSFICSVDKTAYVPDINEQYFETEGTIMLPKAVWVTPRFVAVNEDATVSLTTLQATSRLTGREVDMVPLTDTVLQSASIVTDSIPVGPQQAAGLGNLTFDPDDLDDAATTTLGSYIDAIGDVAPVEDRDVIMTPYDKHPVGVQMDGEYWQTGLAISEFPLSHTAEYDDSVLQQDTYFIGFSINIYSREDADEDHVFYNPHVRWEDILPDDFDASDVDDPTAAVRNHVEASDYDAEDTMYLFELGAPITTERSVETTDLDM